MIARIAGFGLIISLLSYCAWDWHQDRQSAIAREARESAFQQRVDSELEVLAEKFNAKIEWTNSLSPFSKVLTMDLEDLWLGQPVVFRGVISDIASDAGNPDRYVLILEETEPRIWNRLLVSVSAPKAKIDAFLSEHKNAVDAWSFQDRVAAVVQIDNISSKEFVDEEGVQILQTGHGELLHILSLIQPNR